MKTFAIFLLSKETFAIRTCSILESFFRKLLSKENFLVCHYLKAHSSVFDDFETTRVGATGYRRNGKLGVRELHGENFFPIPSPLPSLCPPFQPRPRHYHPHPRAIHMNLFPSPSRTRTNTASKISSEKARSEITFEAGTPQFKLQF